LKATVRRAVFSQPRLFWKFRDDPMPSTREQPSSLNSLWKRVLCGLLLLTGSFLSASRAADNPAKTLQAEFEAAKKSLSAGDFAAAQNHYLDTVVLGLRQLAQLSRSLDETDQATVYLDYALKLKPDDVETQVDEAGTSFRKGDVGKSEALLKSVVASHADNARARGLLGRMYIFEGDSENAIRELKAAEDLEDDFETAYFLGMAYLKAKKLDQAAAWFQQQESTMGDSAALHVLFGRAYLLTKFPQQAISEFRKAIRLDPKYPRAHSLLGYAYLEHFQEEGYPQARAEFEKEIQLYPNNYQALELLGIADVNLRDFPAAESALLRAVRLRPEEEALYLSLGETYAATNRAKQAVEVLQKYVSMEGDARDQLREISRAYYLLGQNLRRLGREEEARKALIRSQQIREAKFKYDVKHIFDEKGTTENDGESRVSDQVADLLAAASPEEKGGAQTMLQQGLPADAAAGHLAAAKETEASKEYREFVGGILGSSYNDLGVMRAKESKFGEAAEFFKQAATWKPDLPGLDRNWGFACFRAELYAEAVPPLERRLKAHPDDSFVRQLLGLSFSVLENYPKVVEILHPLLEHPPSDPALLFAWGTALVRTHQSDHAAAIFRQLLEQNANNASVHLLLGQAYAQQADYSNALAELKIALELDPRLPEAHYYAGLVYLYQSEFESAAQEFRAELQLQPAHALATYHLGYALLVEGHPEQAEPLFREVIKVQPGYESAHFELGRALLEQGDASGAIESLETATKLVPDHDATYFQLSQAYRRAGRTQEAQQALAAYQKLIETNRLKKRESLEIDKP
jgi:tetratricopeptide (TPR) repeat protein